MGKLKKAIQYLEAGKNKERDVAMFLMKLSFGLERRKLRFLKWKENFDWNNDGSIKDKLKLKKEIRMPKELIKALQSLKALYYKSLTPANIRASLVRYLFEQGESLEKIIYLMNIEIWNLGNSEEKRSKLSAHKCFCTFYKQYFSVC